MREKTAISSWGGESRAGFEGVFGGLTGFGLKMAALVLMTMDHIAAYLSDALPIPAFFGMLGRLAAPLFIFMMAQGFGHSRSKKRYLERLLIAAVLMNIANYILNRSGLLPKDMALTNAIFSTMFFIGYFAWAIEGMIVAIKEKREILKALCLLMLPFALDALKLGLVMGAGLENSAALLLAAIIPSPLFAEGNYSLILLGVVFYFLRNRRTALSIFYLIYCGLVFYQNTLPGGWSIQNLFYERKQWLMVFALIFMWAYNGKKGRGMKYFFYIYYPLHIYALAVLGGFLAR